MRRDDDMTIGGAHHAFATPHVVLSACIDIAQCRYDGQRIADRFIDRLMPFVKVTPVCPEVAIGLGIPRPTVRLVDEAGQTRLVQPATGRDLTDEMRGFAGDFLGGLGGVDGFILKSGSPSCGTGQVKVYAGLEHAPGVRKEAGIFAREVLRRFNGLAVEDEGRLRNYPIRHHFLTRLFALADLRRLGRDPSMHAISDFQRRYKHLLMIYDEPAMRTLGRIAANAEALAPAEVYARYAAPFRQALVDIPGRDVHLNALMHMYGHFKTRLPKAERDAFLDMLVEFRHFHLPLHALLAVLRTWCARFEYAYLADQVYLEPYPHELVAMRDSGKGVDF